MKENYGKVYKMPNHRDMCTFGIVISKVVENMPYGKFKFSSTV